MDQANFLIRDFLGRKMTFNAKWNVRPLFIIHIVFDENTPGIAYELIQHDQQGYMNLELTEKGVSLNWTEALRQKLLDLGSGTEISEVKRNYE